MPGQTAAETGNILEKISRNVALVGAIIAALVGMNTALTTCSTQTAARHQTFRQAVEAEELYWRNLYKDYLDVFRAGMATEERDARLFALSVLAQREIPEFREYSLGWLEGNDARVLAQIRLTTMKRRLNEALTRPESSSETVAQQRQDANFTAAIGDFRTPQDRAAAPASTTLVAVATPTPASGVNYLPQTLATGHAQGWDFDIFWCGGGGADVEAQNYAAGLLAARALAELSSAERRLADQKLGRVRLVMLPESRQGRILPTRGSGLEIRPENNPSEHAVANAVREAVPGGNNFRTVTSDTRTPWYISLFACPAGTPAAGRPASNAGRAPPRAAS